MFMMTDYWSTSMRNRSCYLKSLVKKTDQSKGANTHSRRGTYDVTHKIRLDTYQDRRGGGVGTWWRCNCVDAGKLSAQGRRLGLMKYSTQLKQIPPHVEVGAFI